MHVSLSVDKVQNILKNVVFSDAGHSIRVEEEATYMFFIRLLNERLE